LHLGSKFGRTDDPKGGVSRDNIVEATISTVGRSSVIVVVGTLDSTWKSLEGWVGLGISSTSEIGTSLDKSSQVGISVGEMGHSTEVLIRTSEDGHILFVRTDFGSNSNTLKGIRKRIG
jgi:hypothetical protein